MMLVSKPLILFIDAYDSFSNNIISLLETTLDVSVRTVKIDNPILLASDVALQEELRHYTAVVCGPGPGNPQIPSDIGIVAKIWKLRGQHVLPVLGICLGFQSLCLEFGGTIKRLKGPQHGIIRRIRHIGELRDEGSIFSGVGELYASLYQSLCADIGHDALSSTDEDAWKWKSTEAAPTLKPCAWVEHDGSLENDSGIQDGRVLVAVQHQKYPFWGLQYHPESICSNHENKVLIRNWFYHAQQWNRQFRKKTNGEPPKHGVSSVRESLLVQGQKRQRSSQSPHILSRIPSSPHVCHYRKVDYPTNLSIPEFMDAIQDMKKEQIMLESSNARVTSSGAADVRGRYSIIGLNVSDSTRYEFFSGEDVITSIVPGVNGSSIRSNASSFGGIWSFLAMRIEAQQVVGGPEESPFWGGFMGYTTYELGLNSIGVERKHAEHCHQSRADLCFAWITQSLVVDHHENVMYLQDIGPKPAEEAELQFDEIMLRLSRRCTPPLQIESQSFKSSVICLNQPSNLSYESKVRACQSRIRSGTSYELCLTAQTQVTLQDPAPAWSIYKNLRNRQPAPFASYIRLGFATFISASPERFIKWDERGECELRPMKGTVRKSIEVSTLDQAIVLLNVPKEKAENLMIVDLVRHDLHGICGSGNVSVPQLMVVEEYTSVFQMISAVRGRIPEPFAPELSHHISECERQKAVNERYTGLDVLAASLPPGSMTGAPKKRSCEILNEIEDKERSLYSGVVGYIDVRGRGDWSVNIRCMFKWDDDDVKYCHNDHSSLNHDFDEGISGLKENESGKKKTETWYVGAGGAVTALSTPVNEREEMTTKLSGTLAMFRD